MRFSIAAAATALLSLAEARIIGIRVPSEIKLGEPFNAIIVRENYIQAVTDIGIVFGYAPVDQYPETIGQVANVFFLGPDESNKIGPLSKEVTIPAPNAPDAPHGEGLVTAALASIYGASGSPTFSYYNVTVKYGNITTDTYKSSSEWVDLSG
ncbi:hypothetical protein IWW34DRAFT_872597 [Fusarium oxysporum f. sp. albedinis]|nr:hypothetical protein IWW34DRAFT_872597 [Fusarium oxysporum f. sp. albedinis]KAK2471136.1 hypothetical protein H9L39_17367 [Fusarium oxysporum f. sp. albedinis]